MKLASLHVHCLSIWIHVLLTSPLVAQGTGASDTSPAGLSTGDWSSIREIYDAGRYQVVADDVAGAGGYLARNPGQDWSTYFDGRGFTTQPGDGAWSWGLQLQSFGFDGHGSRVSGEASPCADGGRMEYTWTDALTEWYVNDTRGLEHGYTLTERPSGGMGPLTFTLDVRGDLRASVLGDGTGVTFMDDREQAVLTYAGLTVFDAEGTTQQATFAGGGSRLRIVIEEADAKYPLTIDPIAQQVYLKASNAGFLDSFGNSVAVSGDLVVVGAWEESSMATGVDGNESDNSAFFAGAAYVFERIGGVWSQQAYLKASNTNNGDQFGNAVAIFGETVAVGAWQEDGSSTGVNGDQSGNSSHESGAVYVFERSAGVWAQQAYLKASNTDVGDGFGFSLALSGDLLVVGAFQESSNASGVDGTQSNNSSPDSGAAYVFERIGGVWSQQAYLKASNPGAGDQFGSKVGISGETIVVAAPLEDSGAIGVDGDQNDNSASGAGAADVLERVLG
ncbi:MAG: FG-GAP repeat protein, partial [Planctomycetota bacterium]|nr:FG-GAP repeat protein [Planctomycetota bacterium]